MWLNKRKKKIETKYVILIIIVIVIIVLSILSFVVNDSRNLTFIEGGTKNIFVNFQKMIYSPFRYIENKIYERKNIKKIYDNYQLDMEKLSKAILLEEENKELKKEIEALKNQLNLNDILTEYEIINATVINRNVGTWYNTLTIDKGSKQGITNNMAVIINEGLIGKTIKTTKYSSEVKLLTTSDINSKISVAVETDNNFTYGLLTGYDYQNNLLLIDGIIDSLIIEKGDIVITSGLSNIFPNGILVGTVYGITNGEFGLSKTIQVVPSVNFNNIRFVSIIKRKDI